METVTQHRTKSLKMSGKYHCPWRGVSTSQDVQGPAPHFLPTLSLLFLTEVLNVPASTIQSSANCKVYQTKWFSCSLWGKGLLDNEVEMARWLRACCTSMRADLENPHKYQGLWKATCNPNPRRQRWGLQSKLTSKINPSVASSGFG